ncbi:MAG: hypothetical protein M3040_01185 [Bacteroidota bacterium]|nr:hypothetical protein [Bacteroidota bacterium]
MQIIFAACYFNCGIEKVCKGYTKYNDIKRVDVVVLSLLLQVPNVANGNTKTVSAMKWATFLSWGISWPFVYLVIAYNVKAVRKQLSS